MRRIPIVLSQGTVRYQSMYWVRNPWLPLWLNWILPSSGLLRSVAWFKTDDCVLHIDPIFMDQAVQEGPLKIKPICSPETSILNQHTLRDIPEDGRNPVMSVFLWAHCSWQFEGQVLVLLSQCLQTEVVIEAISSTWHVQGIYDNVLRAARKASPDAQNSC